MDESKSTGERLLTGYFDRYSIEHLHRYAMSQHVATNKKVLDIASGEGYGSHLLAKVAESVIGVDIDPGIVAHAATRYSRSNLKFLQGSTDSIPIDDASVDLVISFETLEHHDRHEEMYQEIRRVLSPGGLLIISTPDKEYFNDLPDHRNEYHIKELYKAEFLGLTKRYFKNVSLQSQISSVSSVVCGEDDHDPLSIIGGNHSEVYTGIDLPKPAYHICFASDNPLPTFGPSIFESRDLLTRQEAELHQLRHQLATLSKSAQTTEREYRDIRSSVSFRVGSALVAPFRFAFGRR